MNTGIIDNNSFSGTRIPYTNRELSWLEFNHRVLEEVRDKNNPLAERMKFMSIVSSNLDEFFMVRVASLKDMVNVGYVKPDPSGLIPKQQLKRISDRTHKMVREQYNLFSYSLKKEMKEKNFFLLKPEDLDEKRKNYLENFFDETLFPILTPLAFDSSRPFPLISNLSLNIGVFIKDKKLSDENIFAIVQVPAMIKRYLKLPSQKDVSEYILLEDVITLFIQKLFAGQEIISTAPFRITRNGDLSIEEEEAEDLLLEIEESLKQRRWGEAIRLEADHRMAKNMIELLTGKLEIHKKDVYCIPGPIDLTFLMKMQSEEKMDACRYLPMFPYSSRDFRGKYNIFELLKKNDYLFHHPFDSFEPVIEFVRQAAYDPEVLAIKQTLYRVSGNSPIIKYLSEAAEQGKQVTVLVELKARFDEENNIIWARQLEKSGCHVIYGLVGLKTHCKLLMAVRKEEEGIKRYVHLGTGNYNDSTAKLYTDMGIMTCNEVIGNDVSKIFNMLSGYSEVFGLQKIKIAPVYMRKTFYSLIDTEIANANKGEHAEITCQMNSLVDKEMIAKLYEASRAGVKIKLNVRGICCLQPGVKGISENIYVQSIVGRFLEHSRIYYFYAGGKEKIFLSSADLMTRNLSRRVETLFPVEDPDIKKQVLGILDILFRDNLKARVLNVDSYTRKDNRGIRQLINSQEYFINERIGNKDRDKNMGRMNFENALFFQTKDNFADTESEKLE